MPLRRETEVKPHRLMGWRLFIIHSFGSILSIHQMSCLVLRAPPEVKQFPEFPGFIGSGRTRKVNQTVA